MHHNTKATSLYLKTDFAVKLSSILTIVRIFVLRLKLPRGFRSHPSRLTHLGLVGLSVLRQLDELFGEHAAAVSQNITLQLHVRTRTHELHHDGVAGGVDPNLHVLTTN